LEEDFSVSKYSSIIGREQKLVQVPRRSWTCWDMCAAGNGEEWSPKDKNKLRAVLGMLPLSSL